MVERIERLIDQVYYVPYSIDADEDFLDILKRIKSYIDENHFLKAREYNTVETEIRVRIEKLSSFKSREDKLLFRKIQKDIADLARKILDENKRVFVVHGRNTNMRDQVTTVLGRLKIDWVVLETETNGGNTIVEKFLTNAQGCRYAIVLFSADDLGKFNKEDEVLRLRARQNVVLEMGYFLAKVGRRNLFILHEPDRDIENPSDFSGIVHEVFDAFGAWKNKLIKEMRRSGMHIEQSLADRI